MKMLDDVFAPDPPKSEGPRKLGLVVPGMLSREEFETRYVHTRRDEKGTPDFEIFDEATGQYVPDDGKAL